MIDLQSSSEQQIKKRYRDLSRTLHPDKAFVDESKNQTLDAVNEHWVELTKAYQTLTVEEVRNNYIQYGHPDGKQSFSIGIALPKFMVVDGNGKYVLLVYGLLLGVLLPYIVGKWWYGTQRMTKEKVLLVSAGSLFKEYQDDMTDGDVVTALSAGEEFKDTLHGNKADTGLGKLEKAINQDFTNDRSVAGLTLKDRKRLEDLDGARRKALALLWAYLGRTELDGSALDDGTCTCKSLVRIDTNNLQKSMKPLPLPSLSTSPSSLYASPTAALALCSPRSGSRNTSSKLYLQTPLPYSNYPT